MSRYIYSPSARNMSIYSHRKEFDTPVDELNFAKDYNLKINPISNAFYFLISLKALSEFV